MRRRVLRVFVLRAFSSAMAVLMVTGGVGGVASADPSSKGVPAPETWVPGPANRTPVGEPPPGRPWAPATGKGQKSKTAGDVQAASTCLDDFEGVLPWYPVERHRISDRLEMQVNLYNLNVVFAYRELTVKGTGLNLSVDRFYNTKGHGVWMAGQDSIGLEVLADATILHGPNGYCVNFAPNGDGTFAPAEGLHAKLTKTPDGGYVVSFDESGERWLFSGNGWFVSRMDRNGSSETNRYTPSGRLASVTDSQSRVTRFAYDTAGLPKSITDPAGQTYGNYKYDANQNPIEFTDRDGGLTKVEYTPTFPNMPVTLTDPRGGVYTLTYDTNRRLTTLTKPAVGGVTATTTYDNDAAAGNTTVTDANGHASWHDFDPQGRQVEARDALGHSQTTTWTANSDVNTATDALTQSTTYQYDTANNLVGTKLATGAESTVGYTDAAHPHLPTQVTDGSGNEVTREYDDNGNVTLVRSTGLGADIESYDYNVLGLPDSRTDGKGATTGYEYDDTGNLTKVVPPAPAKPTSYAYDSLSRVTAVTDGNGVRIDYGYDKLDRVVSVKQGATVLQANTFNANGALTGTQTAGATRVLEYDARNRLTKVTRGAEVVSYTYDKVGNVKTLLTPTGTATYGYDDADRLTSLADAYTGTTTFGYDNADHRTSTTFPGGATQTNGYDNAGRQTLLKVTKGTSELFKATYRFTKNGADTDKIQSKTVKSVTTDYTYDGLGRLTNAGTGSYTLDNAGNVLSGEGKTYTVNAADQYTKIDDAAVAFDGAGNYASTINPNSSFTYSKTNQVLTGSLGTSKVLDFTSYDTFDQTQPNTVTETPDGSTAVTHVFTRTAFGVSEVMDNGKRSSFTRDTKGVLVGLKDTAGTRYGAVTDYQGTVLALVDTAGNLAAEYTYTPYGTVTATGTAAASNPFRYVGAYQLHRRTYLMGYRIYDAGLARFRSPDPTGQETNPYNYAKGDPVNQSDPTGAYSGADLGQDVGAGLAGIGSAVVVGAACTVTAGVGCLIGGAVVGATFGALGGGAGAAIGGGDSGKIRDAMISGAVGGVIGGVSGGLVGKGISKLI